MSNKYYVTNLRGQSSMNTIFNFQHLIRISIVLLISLLMLGCGSGGGGDRAGVNTLSTYSLSGTVNGGADDVFMTLSGGSKPIVIVASGGSYSFTGIINGNYTLTPSKANFTFSPASTAINVSNANFNAKNFTATANPLPTHVLSGTITGVEKHNVLVSLNDAGRSSTYSNTTGNYTFTGLVNGIYTATPTLTGYRFSPSVNQVSVKDNDSAFDNFDSSLADVPTYNISGGVSGATQQGVTINLTGTDIKSVTTDVNGSFNFSNLINGHYTVTPVNPGYTFTPLSAAINMSGANVSGPYFTSSASGVQTYNLSGTVIGVVKENVLITLSGTGKASTSTNASGDYSFTGLSNGSYTATPLLNGYSFSPVSVQATVNNANAVFVNLASAIASVPTYSITGAVSGDTKQGVTISLTGLATKTTTTDANGNYSFTGLNNGNYTVTPSQPGYTFNPTNAAVNMNNANVSGPFFTATVYVPPTYSLSGTVSGAVTSGVLITLSGQANATTTTNSSGNYSFSGLTNGSYTATPSLPGYFFNPSNTIASINGANATFANITSIQPTYTLSGVVTGASGVTINLTTGGIVKTTTTDTNGNYSFAGVANGSYTITPIKNGFTFNPGNVSFNISGSNFSAPTISGIGFLMGGSIFGAPLNLSKVVSTFVSTTLNGPIGITTDGNNLYIADATNNRILKIIINTGVMSTLAGSIGPGGYADGIGAAAKFKFPFGITTDGTNLYLSDYYNHRIRKIVIATGEVTTLAGTGLAGSADGVGSSATFNGPTGITTDNKFLYIADTINNKIRLIELSNNSVKTFAGSGQPGAVDALGQSASFNQPYGLTTDGNFVYVADRGNHKIRKIDVSTVVTTLAGSGLQGTNDGSGATASFNGPDGMVYDSQNLYVAEEFGNKIRKIDLTTNIVTTLAGSGLVGSADGTGTAASFDNPVGITSDGSSLFVTDFHQNRIRKIQ